MTSSRYPQITDELLSAYIDNQVTDDDKALIETAVAEDPLLAWQLESLRYTVDLLHTLPQLALPRSFILSDAQLVDSAVSMPALTEPTRVRSAARAHRSRLPNWVALGWVGVISGRWGIFSCAMPPRPAWRFFWSYQRAVCC